MTFYSINYSIKKTIAFLQVISSTVDITTNELLKYQSGSNSERTWVQLQVAINITQLISPDTTEDRKVVFVQECETSEEMNKLEKIVFAEMTGLRVRQWFCREVEEMIRIIRE